MLADILIKPIISEKSLKAAGLGQYTFLVHNKAAKFTIKKAVAKAFKVEVLRVNLVKMKGKLKKAGRTKRLMVKKPDFAKAIVTVKSGQKIDLFEEVKGKK